MTGMDGVRLDGTARNHRRYARPGEGGYTPGWYCAGPSAMCPTSGAPGESADTPLLVGVLVVATPRNRRAYLPRADQLHSDRGEGGNPMVAGRQAAAMPTVCETT